MITFSRFLSKKLVNTKWIKGEESVKKNLVKLMIGIVKSGSVILSEITNNLETNYWAGMKMIQRLLEAISNGKLLIETRGLAIEMIKMRYRNSKYIPLIIDYSDLKLNKSFGYIKPEKKGEKPNKGVRLLLAGVCFNHRVIPINFFLYSSYYPDEMCSSKNIIQMEFIEETTQGLAGREVLIGDREFGNEKMISFCNNTKKNYIFRVKIGTSVRFENEKKRVLIRKLAYEGDKEVEIYKGVYYKGKEKTNLLIIREKGYEEPLCLVSNLENEYFIRDCYLKRMWIEETFRDIKSKGFNLEDVQLKIFERLEIMITILMLTYILCICFAMLIKQGKVKPAESIHHEKFSIFAVAFFTIRKCFEQVLIRDFLTNVIFFK